MPLLFLIIPLLCIFILNLPGHETGGRIFPWVLGLTCALQALMAILSQLPLWATIGFLKLPVPIPLSIDYISAVVLFTISLVAAVAGAAGATLDARKRISFGSLTLILMSGMNGMVMVSDLFSLYVFMEITAVAAYIMIAMDKEDSALEGAFKYLILAGLATLTMLAANALIFMNTGSLRFEDVGAALASGEPTVQAALILFVTASCVKAGVAPFHGWLPGAYSSAPDPVSVLLAGIVTKVGGVYVIVRLMSGVFNGLAGPSRAFMALGAFSIVLGAFAAIGQKDMKRMLAYSSISQVGYIVLAAGLGTPLAIIGALLHFVNHAVLKSMLFINTAAVKEQTGTTDMDKLGGLAEKMKITGWTSVTGFLSAAGVPPFFGFWSKLLIIMALVLGGQWFYASLALLMSLVTLGYFLILQRKVFFGKLREGFEELRESRTSLKSASLLLAAITVIAGILFPAALVILNACGLI